MSDWRGLIENPELLAAAYGEHDPSLRAVQLLKVEWLEDGPIVNLHFTLHDLPVTSPQSWGHQAYNAVAMILQCVGTYSAILHLCGESCPVSGTLARDGAENRRLILSGDSAEIDLRCAAIRLLSLTPSQRDLDSL